MFKIHSKYKHSGDQPQKTLTISNVIEKVKKPTLVLAHNKTLAGQLYSELKELFPENHVEYFVSYYRNTLKNFYLNVFRFI